MVQEMRFRDILDGLANTIMMGEIATDLGDRDIRTIATLSVASGSFKLKQSKYCDQGLIDPEKPLLWAPSTPVWGPVNGRGYRWASHRMGMTGMHTILPPNSELCAQRFPGGRTVSSFQPTSGWRHILWRGAGIHDRLGGGG